MGVGERVSSARSRSGGRGCDRMRISRRGMEGVGEGGRCVYCGGGERRGPRIEGTAKETRVRNNVLNGGRVRNGAGTGLDFSVDGCGRVGDGDRDSERFTMGEPGNEKNWKEQRKDKANDDRTAIAYVHGAESSQLRIPVSNASTSSEYGARRLGRRSFHPDILLCL